MARDRVETRYKADAAGIVLEARVIQAGRVPVQVFWVIASFLPRLGQSGPVQLAGNHWLRARSRSPSWCRSIVGRSGSSHAAPIPCRVRERLPVSATRRGRRANIALQLVSQVNIGDLTASVNLSGDIVLAVPHKKSASFRSVSYAVCLIGSGRTGGKPNHSSQRTQRTQRFNDSSCPLCSLWCSSVGSRPMGIALP